ncbi:hypothetical protein [Pengzhenrongella sicca]|uniref:Uncharacterized protein n=1 Tax=Pengzhenrongella sicca TaxID=2819238 RepID=A0A8A4ZCT3_9MICO|nr:hypothetical protein [Pengzhenrongella sicca]QTE28683.1 hypothetical protein J4E96_15195 [Pengzhenrongella sicca]
MWTSSRSQAQQRTAWYVGTTTAVVVTVSGYALLARATSDGTAEGFLTGGLLIVALAALARWRSVRRSDRAGTAARLGGGQPDERDRRVLEASFAVVGLAALVATSFTSIAALLGADAESLLTALPLLLVAVLVAAFVVINRRT